MGGPGSGRKKGSGLKVRKYKSKESAEKGFAKRKKNQDKKFADWKIKQQKENAKFGKGKRYTPTID